MPKLPRANGKKHIAAFKRVVNHIEGSHSILIKKGHPVHLSIPVHPNQTLGPGPLRKLIEKAGMTPEEYCEYFFEKRRLERISCYPLTFIHEQYCLPQFS